MVAETLSALAPTKKELKELNAMTPHPLDGAFERVTRAGEHLEELNREIALFRQCQENAAFKKLNPQTQQIDGFEPDPIPLRFSILIGEICYNCRAALDYLVYELSRHDSGTTHEHTQFPIENSREGFKRRKKNGLRGINKRHIAMIKHLQPYRGCNWTKALRNISNPDKHRHLTASTYASGIGTLFGPSIDTLGDGDGLVISATVPRGGEMHMKHNLTLTILLPDGTDVVQTLGSIQSRVAKVLVDFKPEV